MVFNRFLPAHEIEWQVETFRWLIETFDPAVFFNHVVLVEPTKAFFPMERGADHEAAERIFEAVRRHMGMEEWPVRLVPQAERIAPPPGAPPPSGPAGTFGVGSDDQAEITYDPALLARPKAFIAAMAHELAHYLTLPQIPDSPGGEETLELTTDLAVTYAGFGLFALESAFRSETEASAEGGAAWSVSTLGYLSRPHHAFALAQFLRAKEIAPEQAAQRLSAPSARLLGQALRALDKRRDALDAFSALRRDHRAPAR